MKDMVMGMDVLIVENNPGDLRLLREMLKEIGTSSILMTHAATMQAAEDHLADKFVDIVLLDLGLPDAQGIDGVRRVQAAAPGIPVVILSALDDEHTAIESLQEGAQDYLIKGQIDSRGLFRALRYAIERKALEGRALALSSKVDLARKEAEAATATKASFVANMSHEIRTPLNSIIGFNDLLIGDELLSGPQRRNAERVQNAADALLTVLDDILDFSKLDAGKVELTLDAFSLEALVRSTAMIVDAMAHAKGLDVRVCIDPALAFHYCGDPARIRQVVLNLLSNAVKFTSAGGVLLDVRRMGSGSSSDHVRFAVSDTGPGVPVESQSRLFQQFSQADPSISREHGGTGLGLSICKSLVELMQGRIGFNANENVGSTFWFEIELATAADAEATPEPIAGLGHRTGLTVLLVEDHVMNQELVCTVLGEAGHKVDIANDGIEGIAAVKAKEYDLILMDIRMPRMDGVTAARNIRDLPGPAAHTPIIALTANALPHQVREYWEAGIDDFVAKPFKRQALHDTIRKVVGFPAIVTKPAIEGVAVAAPAVLQRDGRM